MMHDCDNGDVRDLLPLRLHGTLDARGHARVDAHLAQCASCVEELALLRLVHRALPTPEVAIADVVRVVAAVPTVVGPRGAGSARGARWRMPQWALAAGVSFVLLGGASVQLVRSRGTVPLVDPRPVVTVSDSGVPGAAAERGWSDLSYEQLQQLLDAIDGADPVPSVEPAARNAPIIVPAGSAGRTGGGL